MKAGNFDNCALASVVLPSSAVAVTPGHNAVTLTPLPLSFSESDSDKDNT